MQSISSELCMPGDAFKMHGRQLFCVDMFGVFVLELQQQLAARVELVWHVLYTLVLG